MKGHRMAHWSIRVQATVPAPLTQDQTDALVDALAPHNPSIVTDTAPATVAARLDIEAATLRAAAAAGIKAFTEALTGLTIEYAVEAVEATTYDALDRQLAQPPVPPLVGMAEIATLLGVSRQRAHEVSARPDFPTPVQHLAAGAVYIRAQVEAFNRGWERKRTGRPPNAS